MIQALLHRYKDIFDASVKLPLKREIDHKILTLEGHKLINVRYYKYGHT